MGSRHRSGTRHSADSFLTGILGGAPIAAVLPSLELHHIQPVAAGGKAWDALNCMAVCRSCHIEKTARGNKRKKSATEIRWQVLVDALSESL